MKAAAWYGADDIACPPQYRPGRDQLFRNSEREREELTELQAQGQAEDPRHHLETGGGIAGSAERDRPAIDPCKRSP